MRNSSWYMLTCCLLSDDIHLPTLTVQQTLELALKMKTPGKMLEGVSPKQFREEFLDTLLKMLNISHTKRTLVGSKLRVAL